MAKHPWHAKAGSFKNKLEIKLVLQQWNFIAGTHSDLQPIDTTISNVIKVVVDVPSIQTASDIVCWQIPFVPTDSGQFKGNLP
jgi:hypothetical protein